MPRRISVSELRFLAKLTSCAVLVADLRFGMYMVKPLEKLGLDHIFFYLYIFFICLNNDLRSM